MNPELSQGIVYVSTGAPSNARMCLESMASLRAWGYRDWIFIITDQDGVKWPREKTIIHRVSPVTPGYASRCWKTQAGLLSPFARTIFLDSDILASASLQNIWDEMPEEGLSLAVDVHPDIRAFREDVYAIHQFSEEEQTHTIAELGLDATIWNAGVIMWQANEKNRRFFEQWNAEWQRFQGRDQMAMIRALRQTNTPVRTLEPVFNSRSSLTLTLPIAISHRTVFVHFWDRKCAFHAFAKEIRSFMALPETTRTRLQALFEEASFRHRDIVKGLSLLSFGTLRGRLRLLAFLCRSSWPVLRDQLWRCRRGLSMRVLMTGPLMIFQE